MNRFDGMNAHRGSGADTKKPAQHAAYTKGLGTWSTPSAKNHKYDRGRRTEGGVVGGGMKKKGWQKKLN